MRSKFAASANMIQISFFYQNYYGVSKNEEFYVDFKFVEMGSKMVLEKKESQNFCRGIFWTQINELWIRIKFHIFCWPILILMGHFCVTILALFANFGSIRLKKLTFSDILQTFKTYCFVNSFHFPFESFPFEIQKEWNWSPLSLPPPSHPNIQYFAVLRKF